MPIEVFALAEPRRPAPLRPDLRLPPPRRLPRPRRDLHDQTRYAAIPAFLRTPADAADAYRQMVEENAIRAEVSPWEQAMVAVKSARAEAYPAIDAAIEAPLRQPRPPEARPPAHHRPPRRRPRRLPRPPPRPCRSASSSASPPLIPRGYGDLIRATLAETAATDPEAEWRALLPILAEAERPPSPSPPPAPGRPGRPRRILDAPRPRPQHPPRAHPHRLGPALHRPRRHQRHCSTASSTRSSGCNSPRVLDHPQRGHQHPP